MVTKKRLLLFVFLIAQTLVYGVSSASLIIENDDLTRLDLSGKTVTSKELTIDKPALIKVLILDSCNLLSLPSEIKLFSNLEHISIRYNPNLDWQLTIGSLKCFKKLKFLDLSSNILEEVPSNVAELSHLTGLKLSHNKLGIKKACITLKKIPKLRWLWIDNNELKVFPSSLYCFPKLRFLYGYDNEIKKLPAPEVQTGKLWVLHLGNNKFTQLPKELILVKKLRMVMLNKNPLIFIPEAFREKKYSFKVLMICENRLSPAEKKKADKIFKHCNYSSDNK